MPFVHSPRGPISLRRLLFAGEAIVDVSMRVPAFPAPGADVLAESSQITVGGGFNVMAAAARQGMPVLYAGGHGTGPWGDLVRKALAAEGIEVLRDPDPRRDTGFAVALGKPGPGEADGERAYVTQLGAESVREPGCLDQVTAGPGDAVYISGYGLIPPDSGPVVAEWAAALPPGALLFLDPGPLVPQIPASLLAAVLPRCDWLSCTATEASLLTAALSSPPRPAPDPVSAARALLPRTRNVIIRLAESGCLLALPAPPAPAPPLTSAASASLSPRRAPDESAVHTPVAVSKCRSSGGGTSVARILHVPAPAVTAVDTTGAGDAHAGAFLAALADGLPPEPAARRANAAAALAVTRSGPATARPAPNSTPGSPSRDPRHHPVHFRASFNSWLFWSWPHVPHNSPLFALYSYWLVFWVFYGLFGLCPMQKLYKGLFSSFFVLKSAPGVRLSTPRKGP